MAKLAELIKGFRANVREGNPCEMRFDGKSIQLYPIDVPEIIPAWKQAIINRTHIGIVVKPSTK